MYSFSDQIIALLSSGDRPVMLQPVIIAGAVLPLFFVLARSKKIAAQSPQLPQNAAPPASSRRMMAAQTAGGRTILVTDAMAGAGAADGDDPLGELTATVKDGRARIGHDGAIAGSTLTMDQAVRVMVRAGTDLAAALQAASATPALALNLPEVGSLQAGSFADVVALSADLALRRVMRRGRWLTQATE